MTLQGKRALVTGASSGIGAAVAKAFGARGMRVALTARRQEKLEAVAASVRAAGGEALIVPADVRNEAELLRVFERASASWGGLDVLVNNAGLGRIASMHDGKTEAWREMLDVNVLALAIATREALARFPASGGHIINIGSMASHRIPPKGGFYGATKFAVKVITEITRRELRARQSPTRISQISPGFVETGFFEVLTGDKQKAEQVIAGVGKVLSPEDIARSVLHVLDAPAHVSIHDVWLRPTGQLT